VLNEKYKNWQRRTVYLALLLTFSACKDIETPKGEIPSQYNGHVGSLMGVFRGEFKNKVTTLIVKIDGRKPTIEVAKPKNDLFGHDCGSEIKELQRFSVSDDRLTSAVFGFSSGHCAYIPATEAFLKFDSKDSFQLEVLESASFVENCHPHSKVKSKEAFARSLPAPSTLDPNPLCRWEEKREYARGRFIRVQ